MLLLNPIFYRERVVPEVSMEIKNLKLEQFTFIFTPIIGLQGFPEVSNYMRQIGGNQFLRYQGEKENSPEVYE